MLKLQSVCHLLIICQNNRDISSVDLPYRLGTRSHHRRRIIDLIISSISGDKILVGPAVRNGSAALFVRNKQTNKLLFGSEGRLQKIQCSRVLFRHAESCLSSLIQSPCGCGLLTCITWSPCTPAFNHQLYFKKPSLPHSLTEDVYTEALSVPASPRQPLKPPSCSELHVSGQNIQPAHLRL